MQKGEKERTEGEFEGEKDEVREQNRKMKKPGFPSHRRPS